MSDEIGCPFLWIWLIRTDDCPYNCEGYCENSDIELNSGNGDAMCFDAIELLREEKEE